MKIMCTYQVSADVQSMTVELLL